MKTVQIHITNVHLACILILIVMSLMTVAQSRISLSSKRIQIGVDLKFQRLLMLKIINLFLLCK